MSSGKFEYAVLNPGRSGMGATTDRLLPRPDGRKPAVLLERCLLVLHHRSVKKIDDELWRRSIRGGENCRETLALGNHVRYLLLPMTAKRGTQRRATIAETLRQAIVESGPNFRRLERETGVKRQSLMKFVRGEQSLRLDMADRLATYFDLQLLKRKAE